MTAKRRIEEIMKKKIVALLTMLMVAGTLSGCGEETADLSEIKTGKYVKLGEYKGIEVAVAAPEVTDDYLQSYIDYMLSMNSTTEQIKDRAVADGDTINLDYEGKLDGVAFDGGTAKAQELVIGSNSFIPGFEAGLVGVMPGTTVDLNLNFPDPYQNNPDLAGKAVVFTVTVNFVNGETTTPELTDAIVPTLNPECKTVEEFKKAAYDQLLVSATDDYNTQVESAILEKVTANCEFKQDPPQEMVDDYIEKIKMSYTSMASQYGMEFADLLSQYYGMTEEAFMAEVKPSALQSAQQAIMLRAISDKEKLTLSEADIEAALVEEASENGYEAEEYKELVDEENYSDYAMINKVLEFLKENAVISNDVAEVQATEPATQETAETKEVPETTTQEATTPETTTQEVTTPETTTQEATTQETTTTKE